MKRTLSILLLSLIISVISLTACTGSNSVVEPSSEPFSEPFSDINSGNVSIVDEREPFPALFQLLRLDSPDNIEIFTGASAENTSCRVKAKLLEDIYTAILLCDLQEANKEELSNEYNPDFVDIAYYASFDGPPTKSVSIKKQAEKAYLQYFDEEYHVFSAPSELYSRVLSLVIAQSAPSEVSFEGNYIMLDTPANEEGERYNSFFEANGQIVFKMGNAVLAADGKTGKRLFTIEGGISEVLRPAEYNGGIRLLTQAAVVDYDKVGKEIARLTLPDDIITGLASSQGLNMMYRYDIVNGKIAYPAADGIYIFENGQSRQILKNSDLIDVLSKEYDWFDKNDLEDTPSNFTDPKLMANGTRLCAVINMPNSQNGYTGLVFVNLETGEQKYFFEVFGVLRSGISYLNDITAQAHGQENDTIIDAVAMTVKPFKAFEFVNTSYLFGSNDQKSRFEERSYRDENGYRCIDIILLSRDGEKTARKLTTIKDASCFLKQVTDNYLIYEFRDSKKRGVIAIPI